MAGILKRGVAAALCASALLAAPASAQTPEHFARAEVAHYRAAAGPTPDCEGPAGDPAPGSQEWQQRDLVNQYCATERLQDEFGSPAFAFAFNTYTPGRYAQQNLDMLGGGPGHTHGSLGQLVPGGTTTDPFRTIERWTAAGRGRVDKISFPASDGATLNGYIFRPPATVKGPYPGVVITTGSIQGYQQMYFWAAEGLAEAGYEVMTYDVQGQGNSDTLPAECTGPDDCPGVPFQQEYNFFQGAEDSLNFFLSTRNPGRAQLDRNRVGIAGHSLGASAVSQVGQCDPRVKAIVAWDNLAEAKGNCRDQVPDGLPASTPAAPTLKTPALGINSEYFFNPTPMSAPPDPQSKAAAYKQLTGAGTDAMQIALRSSTHLEYTYVPYILPASRLGERAAFHYTLAWFDRYLRGMRSGYDRLTARSSTAAPTRTRSAPGPTTHRRRDPTDPTAGNVPYAIKGLPVADRFSIYYASEYSLTRAGGGPKTTCADMRAGCR